jgi:hypothetical protein
MQISLTNWGIWDSLWPWLHIATQLKAILSENTSNAEARYNKNRLIIATICRIKK